MEQPSDRNDILRESLTKNSVEVEKWQSYKKDNEIAIENLDTFIKHLNVDVMVPVGSKALLPGKLIHTNEILVGHYQGYFSKCSAEQAKIICKHRLQKAEEHLKKLEKEQEFFDNKLNKPFEYEAMPFDENSEIIEEYDEERERLWEENHILSLKKSKEKEMEEWRALIENEEKKGNEEEKEKKASEEKKENEVMVKNEEKVERKENEEKIEKKEVQIEVQKHKNAKKIDEDINIDKIFDELKLKEQLDNEFDQIEDNAPTAYEIVQNLLNAKSPITQTKKRISKIPVTKQITQITKDEKNQKVLENIVQKNTDDTIINETSNAANTKKANESTETATETPTAAAADTAATETATVKDNVQFSINEEIAKIEIEYNSLNKSEQRNYCLEKIKFYDKEFRELTEDDENRKNHLINVITFIRMVMHGVSTIDNSDNDDDHSDDDSDELSNAVNVEENALKIELEAENIEKLKQQKRRISFALDVEKVEFRANEAVSQMLPNRKVINLDDSLPTTKANNKVDIVDKKEQLLEKVTKNIEFMHENQSERDKDLVSKIIDDIETMNIEKTLYIKFHHSAKSGYNFKKTDEANEDDNDIPGCPADIYKRHATFLNEKKELKEVIYLNAFKGEEDVKVPLLTESKRLESFEDPKLEFLKSIATENVHKKSILRNKEAIEKETHILKDSNKNLSKKMPKKNCNDHLEDNEEHFSAFNMIMGDLKPKTITEPEQLPKTKFVDAHAPKNRISHFKKLRTEQKANKEK